MSEREAGREMDAEIAEQVLGWSGRTLVWRRGAKEKGPRIAFQFCPDKWGIGEYSVHYLEDGTKLYCGNPWAPHFAPPYSTDIAAAWTVVEHMRDVRHLYFMLSGNAYAPQFGARFVDGIHMIGRSLFNSETPKGWEAVADTLTLAICRAALAAAHPEGGANE